MIAILKRELKAYFHSMTGWLFVAAVMFLTGIYFMSINLLSGYSSIANTLASASFIYVLTIPILTMRILSEERKQKVDQLILTAPVRVGQIVLGKYLAMCIVLLLPITVIAIYPLILSSFGTVALLENYIAILGFLLYGMTAIAMGLWISSLTENQVIAAILSFAAMFVTYMMSGICSLLTVTENSITVGIAKVLSIFDFSSRFDLLLNGQIDFTAILYYVTMIVMFLFLTSQVIFKRRYSVSSKNLKVGAYSVGMILVAAAAAVFFQLMVAQLPTKYTKFDVTQEGLYSITEKTEEFLKTLQEDVTIYVLASEEGKDEILDSTLEKYKALSEHIQVEYKDPVKTPTFYRQYTTDNSITMNSLIVESSKRYKVINYSDIYTYEIDYSTYSQTVTGYDGEGQLTSAISYVVSDSMPTAYRITGHDELSIDAGFLDAIEKQNVTVEDLNLLTVETIPTDAEFLLLTTPGSDYSALDAKKVIAYVENGGQLLVTTSLAESMAETMPNFQTILDCFHTEIVEGMIVEGDSNYYYGDPSYLLPEVMDTPQTEGVYGEKYVFVPYAQGIYVTEDENTYATSILRTSEQAYSKVDIAQALSYDMEENDIAGPFDIGVYVKRTYGEQTGEMFLFTSGNIFTDAADAMVANANLTIFSNCLAAFIDSETENIVIPAKALTAQTLTISAGSGMLIGLLVSVVIPLVLICCGCMVWYHRRRA